MSTPIRALPSVLAALLAVACGPPSPGPDAGSGDVVPPTIRSTTPMAAATNVPLDVVFVVVFSEAMKPDSVALSLSPAATLDSPRFDDDHSTLIVSTSAPLAAGTLFNATVSGTDEAGNALAGLSTFTFTTRTIDVTAPTIASTVPANGAMSVSSTTPLSITFSERMDVATVTVEVSPVADLGTATWSGDDTTIAFAPAGLAPGTTHTVTVAGKDLAGNALSSPATFSFTTGTPPDVTPPTVVDTSPGDGDTGVSNNTLLTLNFSEPMRAVPTEAALTLRAGTTTLTSCASRWLWNAQRTIVSCQPTPVLAFLTQHSVTVGTGAQDDSANALAAPLTVTFTTSAAPDTTPPTVSSVTPTNTSIGVERTSTIKVTFSETMNTSATQASLGCVSGVVPIEGSMVWATRNRTVTLTPTTALENGVTVTCTVRGGATGARDVAGNLLAANYVWSFRVLRQATLTLNSTSDLDGSVFASGGIFSSSGVIVGDNAAGVGLRGFYSFDLTALPADVRRITLAQLSVYVVSVSGQISSLGPVMIDHVAYGANLTGSAYGLAPLSSSTWSLMWSAGTRRAFGVMSWLEDDVSHRAARGNRSQFRLRFSTEASANGSLDAIFFSDALWPTQASQHPMLSMAFEFP